MIEDYTRIEWLKEISDGEYFDVVYITPNNQIKTKRVRKTVGAGKGIYTPEEIAYISANLGILVNNDYIFVVDEPSHIVGMFDPKGCFISQWDEQTLAGFTSLERFSILACSSSFIPEYLEESDFRQPNVMVQIWAKYTVNGK